MSYIARSTDRTSMQAICLIAHHHTTALCLHTSHCRIDLFMGSVHCLILWKQHNGPETESVPILWDKSGEAPPKLRLNKSHDTRFQNSVLFIEQWNLDKVQKCSNILLSGHYRADLSTYTNLYQPSFHLTLIESVLEQTTRKCYIFLLTNIVTTKQAIFLPILL